jgi:hypothetical protein
MGRAIGAEGRISARAPREEKVDMFEEEKESQLQELRD